MSDSPLAAMGAAVERLAEEVKRAGDLKPHQVMFALSPALEALNASLPPMLWWWQAMGNSLLFGPIQAAFEAGFFQHVPAMPAEIDGRDLAALVDMDEDRVVRVMRFLTINGIFTETAERRFSHSTLSAAVSNSAVGLTPAIEWSFTDTLAASTSLAASMKTAETERDCWTEQFGVPLFEYLELEKNANRRTRYHRAVAQHTIAETDEISTIVPWEQFPKVVDVGGGAGYVAAHLTKHFEKMHVVNQDLAEVINDRQRTLKELPAEEQAAYSRTEFEAHDYYTPQTRTDANAFLIRFCLHNNNNANCIRILKSLVPGLANNEHGSSARLLIAERVMPEWDTDARPALKQQRIEDLAMLISCSGKQRTVKEYEALLKVADPRYEIDQVHKGAGIFQVLSIKLSQS